MRDEQLLLDGLPHLEDLQTAWLLLSWSAVPRSDHLVRILAPRLASSYAKAHDTAVWSTFAQLVDDPKWLSNGVLLDTFATKA